MKIKRTKDFYDLGIQTFLTEELSINPGITVLVGCNGYGKSTTISLIEEHCKRQNIELFQYDSANINHTQRNMQRLLDSNQLENLALMVCSSEGERLTQGFCDVLLKIGAFVRDRKQDKKPFCITLDALDSGLSIDEQIEYNGLFHTLQEDIEGLEGYVIISTNNYELTSGLNCLDVYDGSIVRFKNYEQYKNYILKTNEIKNRRYEEDEYNAD